MQRREGTHHKARRAAFAVDRIHVCAKLAQHPKRSHVAVLRRLRAHRQHSQLLLSVGGGCSSLGARLFLGCSKRLRCGENAPRKWGWCRVGPRLRGCTRRHAARAARPRARARRPAGGVRGGRCGGLGTTRRPLAARFFTANAGVVPSLSGVAKCAPRSPRSRSMATLPNSAATNAGVMPAWLGVARSPPRAATDRTASKWPRCAATNSGVAPWALGVSSDAPSWPRHAITSAWPASAATKAAVLPSSVCDDRSA